MKLISAIINILLVLLITISGSVFILDRTADAEHLSETAETSGVYKGVSEVVSRQLVEIGAKNLGVDPSQIPQEAKDVVSEEYIATKSQEVTAQIEEALRGERSSIKIDISDLADEAQAAGLTVNKIDLKPIEIQVPVEDQQAGVRASQNLDLFKFISYTLTGILLAASIAIGTARKKFTGLAVAFLASAIIFGLLAVLAGFLKGFVAGSLELPNNISEISPYAQTFTASIVGEISRAYFWFAVASTIIGLGIIIGSKNIARLKKDTVISGDDTDPFTLS